MIPAVLVGPGLRLLGYALALTLAFGAGAKWMHGRMTDKYDKLNAEYSQFKGGVQALGSAAEQAAAKRKLLDIKAKEYADAKNVTDLAAARARIAKLRASRNDTRGGSVSAAPAGSRCPDGAVCFDRAEYQRAVGEFTAGARRLADEGTQVTTDLNTAREWANRRAP